MLCLMFLVSCDGKEQDGARSKMVRSKMARGARSKMVRSKNVGVDVVPEKRAFA